MLLEDTLHQLSDDADKQNMYSQWIIIKKKTESKLKTVCNYFPHFSKHDSSHSQTIATYIGNLLGEDRINKLSYSDILMMLLSFYKHDIGMALEYEDVYKRFHSSTFKETLDKYANDKTSDLFDVARRLQRFGGVFGIKDYETSIDVYNDVILVIEDMYRSEHAKRSADAIMNDDFLENILHNRCQRILAEICEAHQKSIVDIIKLPWKENGLFGDYFHPRFIGAMLCLGDLLDLDTDRFDEIMMKASTPFPQLSKLHLEKHKSIRHFLVDKNVIEVSTNTDDIEVYRIMRKWMDWMQEACDYIALHWSEIAPDDFGNAPRISKCELLLHGDKKWIPFANTKYEVSDKKMFELLKGSNIYNNKFVCIREIIQNAVDATLLRLFNERTLSGDDKSILQQLEDLKWDDYEIKGEIGIVDNTHVRVKVRDRGIGVSTDDIRKIANVSNIISTKRKELISKMPMWLRPSGAFGMGLQSIFLLADQFEMITKTSDEPAKKIIFQSAEDSDGYITVEDYNEDFKQGTEIRFIINGEKLSAVELDCSSYHYKRKELSGYVINKIYSEYENQSESVRPEILWKKEETDYVPVDIKYVEDEQVDTILKYESLFSAGEIKNDVKVQNKYIEVRKFIPELNCYIISGMYLDNKNKKEEKLHSYGMMAETNYYYHKGVIYYRNRYVKSNVFHESFYSNEPIMPYVNWHINLLDANSDEVLKMSRNSINENYIGKFYKTLINALELAVKDVVDYLIDKYVEEEDGKIGDIILIVYQLAIQIKHRVQEIYNKYKYTLEMIKINNYYLWGGSKETEKIIPFGEIPSEGMYFIANEVIYDDSIESTNLDDKICFELERGPDSHILNHRIKKIFLGKKGNQYVKVVEAIPFECNHPNLLYDIDDIFMLENIIRMIELSLRVIPATKGYEILVTPISSYSQLNQYAIGKQQYYIEMPFAELISELSTILHNDGYIPNAIDEYYEQVKQSETFVSNVNYIQDITNKKESAIRSQYQQIVKKCLELLENEKYRKFNISILEIIEKEKTFELVENNLIENNPFIAYESIFLD